MGKHAIIEALKADQTIDKVLVLYGIMGKEVDKIRKLARKKNVIVSEVNKLKFRELIGDATTQGVLAIITEKEYLHPDALLEIAAQKEEKPFIIIADEVIDPHNIGAIARSAEAVGAHGMIIPRHHSPSVNQTISKVSSGASEYLPFARVTNIAAALDDLKSKGLWIVGTDPAAEKFYYEIDYNIPIVVIIGNEKKGMRKLVKEKCDFVVRIPMFGKINSLNASVAGGILLYEVARKRKGF